MNTYRASHYVRIGVADEHAHNMFLSFMEQCHRLGLWGEHIKWFHIQAAFHRLTQPMKTAQIKRKLNVQSQVQNPPRGH